MQVATARPVVKGALVLAGLAALAASLASAASAAPTLRNDTIRISTIRHDSISSANWAGYGVTSLPFGTAKSFTNVAGTWVQPAVTCTANSAPSYSAFWVGLGGLTENSTALEQTGTEANCGADGTATYDAWYEIIPAPPVPVKLTVRPGDTISAIVTITGKTVKFRLQNLTLHTIVNKKVKMKSPDLSSAEWIAEAPSACTDSNHCTTLPLANFGTVNFLGAAATASKHTGLIADTAWNQDTIELDARQGGGPLGNFAGGNSSASAIPSPLTSFGGFSVAWTATPPTSQPSTPPPPQ
jgi:hypothetical protein